MKNRCLCDLKTGEKAQIINISSDFTHKLHLVCMGLLPGDVIEVVAKAPTGGPISFKNQNFRLIGIRAEEAKLIEIGPLSTEYSPHETNTAPLLKKQRS